MKEEKKKLSYYQRKKQGLLNPRDGRPSSYKPEYCEQIIEYFDQEPHRDVLKKRMTTKDGTEIEEFEMRATDPRFIIGFSRLVGVTRKTLLSGQKIIKSLRVRWKKPNYCKANTLESTHFR